MERHEVLALMDELKLVGMRAAYDEVLGNALKRQHPAPQIVGSLLQAEIAKKQARSIRYQVTVAKLPLIKELAEFEFAGTPINEGWCARWPPGHSWTGSATRCWWVAPAPARPTSPWRSR